MTFQDFYKGISISKMIINAFDSLKNCDVHTEPGLLRPQKALAKESGTTAVKGYYQAVVPSGDTYFFSKTDGTIIKRTAAGVYSSVRTNSNGAHKGAAYYRNKLYYSTDSKLGVFDLSSTWNDNFQVLTASVPHPLFQFDLILYIGNGKDIAQLDDADVFTSSALDLPVEHKISAISNIGDDLVTLSNPGDYINNSAIFRWDTYSDSWAVKDSIKEIDAYAFLDADNFIYAVCSSGNVYIYNGQQLELFTVIRNVVATSGHQLTTNYKGKPLIANGGTIYSLHRSTRDFPIAFVGEYTCSAGADATIHSMAVSGNNLLVSWEKSGAFGIDNISANYSDAEIVTPVFRNMRNLSVSYDVLPTGTDIEIYLKKDGGSSWTQLTTENDAEDRRQVRISVIPEIKSMAQAKIVLKSDGTDYPIISSINVDG